MRKNCASIVAAFAAYRAASEKSVSTDGTVIRSYALRIARRVEGGVQVLATRHSPSHTTTTHINAVRRDLVARGVDVVEVDVIGLE